MLLPAAVNSGAQSYGTLHWHHDIDTAKCRSRNQRRKQRGSAPFPQPVVSSPAGPSLSPPEAETSHEIGIQQQCIHAFFDRGHDS